MLCNSTFFTQWEEKWRHFPSFSLHTLYVSNLTGSCNSKSISTLDLHVNGLLRISFYYDPTDFKKARLWVPGRQVWTLPTQKWVAGSQEDIVAVPFKGCNLKICDEKNRTTYQNVSHGKVCERCWADQAIKAHRMTARTHNTSHLCLHRVIGADKHKDTSHVHNKPQIITVS